MSNYDFDNSEMEICTSDIAISDFQIIEFPIFAKNHHRIYEVLNYMDITPEIVIGATMTLKELNTHKIEDSFPIFFIMTLTDNEKFREFLDFSHMGNLTGMWTVGPDSYYTWLIYSHLFSPRYKKFYQFPKFMISQKGEIHVE